MATRKNPPADAPFDLDEPSNKTSRAAAPARKKTAARPAAPPKPPGRRAAAPDSLDAPDAPAASDGAAAAAGKTFRAVAGAKGSQLLIVESPAKSKTIGKFLGAAFTVKASMGHVRDIPSKGRGRAAFGIDFDNRYQPAYEPIPDRKKVLGELRTASDRARHVWLAPDPDREGEAIAWHLKEALDISDDKVSRVTFNAITKSAVAKALEHPGAINMDLVNAQQGRRVLDRLVGFSLSPLLWKKISKGLSAGRVQSVAARLVADREKEIRAFKTEEYWRVTARFAASGPAAGEAPPEFEAQLVLWNEAAFGLGHPDAANESVCGAVVQRLEQAGYAVGSVEEREIRRRSAPPFITSTLQQAASTFLGFPVQKTMRVAQQLYEGIELEGGQAAGLITYMRTDSTRLAPEALADVREYIAGHYASGYLPDKPNVYSTRANAQDAHEAIRPAAAAQTPASLKDYLTQDQFRLYDLIWRRCIASQMNPAVYLVTTVAIPAVDAGGSTLGVFEAKGRRTLFEGHTVLSLGGVRGSAARETAPPSDAEADAAKERENAERAGAEGDKNGDAPDADQDLPALAAGDPLALRALTPSQHFTQPPPRYSEASLVRALEKEGIGRPSTYGPIVQTIQDRGYVRLERRRFHATELGLAVCDLLERGFPDIMDPKFTAKMESDLDAVEEGKEDWADLMDRFWKPFSARVEEAGASLPALKGAPAPEGVVCPSCGGAMTVRYSQSGAFLGCSNYPECRGTRPLPGEDAPADGGGDNPEESETCPDCGGAMNRKTSRFGPFWACANYPECKKTKPIDRQGKTVKLPDVKRDCERCGMPMRALMGRRGPFLACSGYPKCKNTKHIGKDGQVVELPDAQGEKCDKCGADMVTRMSRRGPFLACSAYPKCKNARNLGGKPKEKQ